jgi:BA14K-like protein
MVEVAMVEVRAKSAAKASAAALAWAVRRASAEAVLLLVVFSVAVTPRVRRMVGTGAGASGRLSVLWRTLGRWGDEDLLTAPIYTSNNSVSYCEGRFHSYDLASGTYLGFDGFRHPCP